MVPSLQDEAAVFKSAANQRVLKHEGVCEGWDITFYEYEPEHAPGERESMVSLLRGFFAFYLEEWDMEKDVVSIRAGEVLSRKEAWGDSEDLWRLSIQDPFELDRDLGKCLNENTQRKFIDTEMQRALTILRKSNPPGLGSGCLKMVLNALCEPAPAKVQSASNIERVPVVMDVFTRRNRRS